jgi:hypothetical protein
VANHLMVRVDPVFHPDSYLWLPAEQVGAGRGRGMPAAVLELRLGGRARHPEVLRHRAA